MENPKNEKVIMTKTKTIRDDICPTETALSVMGGKWKGMILFYLADGTKRYNELKRLIPGITQRMLTKQLRDLETDGIIHRKVYPVIPPKVEYSLTDTGKNLKSIISALRDWGEDYLKEKK